MSTTKSKTKLRNTNDLPDSADDKKHLEPEETTIDLPDVEDIPGQEHIKPLPAGEMADTTISSADEEGESVFGSSDLDEDENEETTVSAEERELLAQSDSSMATPDDIAIQRAKLDNVDEEGTPLNEKINQSGADLDVPGSEDDDANEEIGEEDEENNSYSLNDDKEDEQTNRT